MEMKMLMSNCDLNAANIIDPEALNRLQAYQRLAKIGEKTNLGFDFDVDDDWLSNFPKYINISSDIEDKIKRMDKLISFGFDSATAIAEVSKQTFIKSTEKKGIFGDNNPGEAYYDSACSIAVELSLHYLHSYQTLSPCVSEGWAFKGSTTFSGNDNYPELFGKLDYFNADESNSIHSPTAYFFELMRIATDNQRVNATANPFRSLAVRRPDLLDIPLDSTHTFKELPYLTLVNYILGKHYIKNCYLSAQYNEQVKDKTYDDKLAICETTVFENIASARQLFYPPFVLPAEKIHACLKPYNTSLFDIFSAFEQTASEQPNFDDLSIAREYLGLSVAEVDWLKTMDSLSKSLDLKEPVEVKTFCAVTGLKKEQWFNLIPYDTELTDQDKITAYQQLYINNADSAPITIYVDYVDRSEKIKNLTSSRLLRLSTFSFLAKKLALSNNDLQSLCAAFDLGINISENNIKTIAKVVWLSKNSKLSFSNICLLVKKLSPQNFDTIINNPALLKKSNAESYSFNGTELADTLINPPREIVLRLCVSIGISPIELFYLIDKNVLEYITNNKVDNLAVVDWLYRSVNTARLLGISVFELVKLYHMTIAKDKEESNLVSLFKSFLIDEKNSTSVLDNIVALFAQNLWIKQAQIDINSLYYSIYGNAAEVYKTKLEQSAHKFLIELQKDVSVYQGKSALLAVSSDAKDKHASIEYDKFICQKIAVYFNEPFELVETILRSLVSDVNNNVFVNVIAQHLHLEGSLDTTSKFHPGTEKILILFRMVMLAKTLQLTPSTNEKNYVDDIAIFCSLIKSGYQKITLDNVKLLVQIKRLQKLFHSKGNDFLKYFHSEKKHILLSQTKWDTKAFDQLCGALKIELPKSKLNDKQEFNPTDSPSELTKFVNHLIVLQRIFTILQKLNNHVDILLSLSKLKEASDDTAYSQYDKAVHTLYQLASTKTADEKQKHPLDETLQQFETKKRDTLVHHLLRPALLKETATKFKKYDVITKDDVLNPGDYLLSKNKSIFAVLEEDGNFAIYQGIAPSNKHRLIWQTGTSSIDGKPGKYLAFIHKDGNFALANDSKENSYWTAHDHRPFPLTQSACFLRLEDNGTLCLYEGKPDAPGERLWRSNAIMSYLTNDKNYINNYLRENEYLLSTDGQQYAILEVNGNFTIYQGSGPDDQKELLWQIKNPNEKKSHYVAYLQPSDGNFAIAIDDAPEKSKPVPNSSAFWTAHDDKAFLLPGQTCFLKLEEKGILCLYEGKPLETTKCLWQKTPSPQSTAISHNIKPKDNWSILKTAADLSEYLLIDVEMSSCFLTSPIAQGIGSIQLYLQRCRLGIERGVAINVHQAWWPWLENYRLWEANRKVLLHPENYIEPDLRTKQSPEFKQLTHDLLQTNLDKDAVDSAFRQYFHKINSLSDLVYCAACVGKKAEDSSIAIIYLFAHTRTAPFEYYLRTVEYANDAISQNTWTYWNKISTTINAGLISPIYAFDRLFIFFVEPKFTSHKGTEITTENKIDNTKSDINLLSFNIKCTYQNSNGAWEHPQDIYKEKEQPIVNFMGLFLLTYFPNLHPSISNPNHHWFTVNSVVKNGILQLELIKNYTDDKFPIETENAFKSDLKRFNNALNHIDVEFSENKIHLAYLIQKINLDKNLLIELNGNNNFLDSLKYPNYNYQFDIFKRYPINLYNDQSIIGQPQYFLAEKTSVNTPTSKRFILTPSAHSDLITIKAQPNIVLLNNVDENYLILQKNNIFYLNGLSSRNVINQLNSSLIMGGFDNLYQMSSGLVEQSYTSLSVNTEIVVVPTVARLDFNSGFADYYWEIFFHVPFYVANRLNAQQRFMEARAWYHYIFNPLQTGNRSLSNFKFQPFQNIDLSCNLATDQKIMAIYHDHMFDPHSIAELRPIAYMKAVVMKYIKNLIDWGDYEFSLNTRESITQARNLYQMAKDLLGDKPQALGSAERNSKIITFQQYLNEKIALNEVTERIFKVMENNLKEYKHSPSVDVSAINDFSPYFNLPENKEFIAYWDRIEDRLFKIRHCQNIDGVVEKLDLFAPELDAHQLVRLAASPGGEDIRELINPSLPNYRFEILLSRAKDMTSQVIQLGNELLSVLEKQDFESLSLLNNRHQASLLDTMSLIKQKQIEEAQLALEQTQANIKAAENRLEYYSNLMQNGLIDEEKKAKKLRLASHIDYGAAAVAAVSSQAAFAVPQFSTGFAAIGPYETVTEGGLNVGHVAQALASGLEMSSTLINFKAEDLLTEATYQRRDQEWRQLKQQTEDELVLINKQLKMNQVQLDIAKQDYANQQLLVKQQQELMQYFQSKFTNIDLYRWYIDSLLVIYRQAYDLAHGMAKSAETAYQFEFLTPDNKKPAPIISRNHYSFFRKGLLAGQGLQGELSMMEKSYFDKRVRLQEIEKTISVKKLNEGLKFKDNNCLSFSLKKALFDEDFENLINRRIKRISVSIPALAKPYQNINLILTMTKSYNEVSASGSENSSNTNEFGNAKQNVSIVLSTGINDTGLFEANLQDARYLPFEGAWVYSDWELTVGNSKNKDKNKDIVNSITDVIIQLLYTAQFKDEPKVSSSVSTVPSTTR